MIGYRKRRYNDLQGPLVHIHNTCIPFKIVYQTGAVYRFNRSNLQSHGQGCIFFQAKQACLDNDLYIVNASAEAD